MEGGGEGRVGRKWVGIGRVLVGGVCEGGGPQARRRGAPPKRAEPVCPPGRRAACGRVLRLLRGGGGDEGKGRGGQRGRPVGAQRWGRSPFRRSRKPQAEPAETARRAVGLRRDAGAFAFSARGWGRRPVCPRLLRGGGGACPKWCAAGERTVPAGGSLV